MYGAPSPRNGPYPPLQPGRQGPSKTRWTTGRQKRPERLFANWVPCNRLYPELQEAEIEGTKRQKYALTIRIPGLSLASVWAPPAARTKGFPWVVCSSAKNGSLKPTPDAFRFGTRYMLNDVLHFESFRTLDEAVANLK